MVAYGNFREARSEVANRILMLHSENSVRNWVLKLSILVSFFFQQRTPGSPYLIEFVEVEIKGEPKAIEHSEMRWCNETEMLELSFAPADTKFVEEYLLKENQ